VTDETITTVVWERLARLELHWITPTSRALPKNAAKTTIRIINLSVAPQNIVVS